MKMKIAFLFTLLILTITTFGQKFNGYKYVRVIPLTYSDGDVDKYGIANKLIDLFTSKGFLILKYNAINIPLEIKQNPCLLMSCFTTSEASGLTFKVNIEIIDCNNKTVFKNQGTSLNWADDYAANFQHAASKAFDPIKNNSYAYNQVLTPTLDLPIVEKTSETEESIKNYLTTNKLDVIEGIYKSYNDGKTGYYRFGIIKSENKFKAIIIESEYPQWKQGEVKAYFEQSSMKGFYSTKWYMGNKSSQEVFCQLDNSAILSVNLPNQKADDKTPTKFVKLFPPITSDGSNKKDAYKASGSGFFISTTGIIATNAHVIEDASNIEITFTNEISSFTYKAKVILSDSKNDVALLKIDDDKFKGFSAIPFGINEKAETGEKVFTIGYPLNDVMGTNYKVNDGIISSKSGIADDVRYYQISVPLQPGNSGGPLFSKDGNVIGITSARLNGEAVGTKIENVNYAIKASYLLNLYNMLPNSGKINSISQVANKELQEQVKILKNYVCLIRVF